MSKTLWPLDPKRPPSWAPNSVLQAPESYSSNLTLRIPYKRPPPQGLMQPLRLSKTIRFGLRMVEESEGSEEALKPANLKLVDAEPELGILLGKRGAER